jgi:uncharacterized protein YutD
MILFMSDFGIEIMAQSEKWHFNGTFKKCPKLLKQLLTVHDIYKNESFSCAYFVLPDKTSKTYKFIFDKLKEILLSKSSELKVKEILSDFEAALINQLKMTFRLLVPF